MSSGLYDQLASERLLVSHQEVSNDEAITIDAHRVIQPELVPFISYPYEWCFSQLRDAALTTLKIQKISLSYGMTLKDSSAFNIQFINGNPIFIDTLSFEKYIEGEPWIAYRQFCQHFLAPLALMSYTDVRLSQLSRIFIDGNPLDLAVKLLPLRSRLNPSLLVHLHLHAKSQSHYADKPVAMETIKKKRFVHTSFLGLLANLESCIKKMAWSPKNDVWANYYADIEHYGENSFNAKKLIISDFLEVLKPHTVWDLGANTGLFSRIASDKGIATISFEIDPACVEINYRTAKRNAEKSILPLVMDLTNPTSGIGWNNQERMSLVERGPADTVLALALIHHLCISNNVPLGDLAGFLSKICKSLIIEFVPKSDIQVQRLFQTRKDIFHDYTQQSFEKEFIKYFNIACSEKLQDTERTIYMMHRSP